jgi:pSer/pThr/pTyr-binding forkhead associated (FHA) protein
MQIILKPTSHPDLGEIIIKDSLFAIGRHEPPFASYDPQVVTKLSRRHSRIFEQDGDVYIADLSSLNGTTVNGVAVDKIPVKLRRGDTICFAGYLCYEAEILGTAARRPVDEPAAPPLRLVLVPEQQEAGLEPVVVTQFPFLVTKASDVFARYRDTFPGELKYISRRHAHIFLREQCPYIEDLGSTNGTFVSGVRLEEQARRLRDGDVIALGGDHFVYRVRLEYGDAAAAGNEVDDSRQVTATVGSVEDVTRTTFVTSANSFLDIFCSEDEAVEADDQVAPAEAGPAGKANRAPAATAARGWRRLFTKPQSFLREIRIALADDTDASPRRLGLAALLLALVGVGAFGIYYSGASLREIRGLLDAGDYAQAAVRANVYLQSDPADDEVVALATEALLKDRVPAWVELVEAEKFTQAEQQLEAGRRLSLFNPEGQELLDIMQWMTGLERFIAERGGPDSPTRMFEEPERINALLDGWAADPKLQRRLLGTIALQVPAFVDLRARVFSHLRSLEGRKSLDIVAIDRLLATVREHLEAGHADRLEAVFADFDSRYPGIVGIQALREDLANYVAIDEQIGAENWLQAERMTSTLAFQTPPFRDRIASIRDAELPPKDIVSRYAQAANAWQQGHTDEAMGLLEALATERWGEVAVRELEQKRGLLQDFERLKGARGTPEYQKQLLVFYGALDPRRDGYFMAAVEDEFKLQREKALSEAQQAFADARAVWKKYRTQGGIGGLQRIEADVSPTFQQRAAMLSEAYGHLNEGTRVYRLLNTPYSTDWDTLNRAILREIGLQRRSLRELAMVLEPSLLAAKLELLPDPQHSDEPGDVPVNGLNPE